MATGGAPFDDGAEEQELHNWTISNGSLDDQLNNMQKKANRTSEKNRKKLSAVSESRLTNDISPESTPGAGRRRARTPHSFPHVKYATQMSVPDQAELDRLRQRINFTDLDERSIGSDSQGRVTAANNQRQLSSEPRKPFNFLPLHVNTNKSRDSSASAPPATTTGGKETKKQSPGKELFAPVPVAPVKEPYGAERTSGRPLVDGRGELAIDSSQVVSKLVQIREYISRASSMRDDLLEKNDVPANVERLSHLITHLKEQEKSYLRFLQKMLCYRVGGQQKEELENLRQQHELLQKMLQQQEELRELQNRQAALLTMQNRTNTMDHNRVSGVSITSELNDELNDLIRRFHNQLHDSQSQAVPDNRVRLRVCLVPRGVPISLYPQEAEGGVKRLNELRELVQYYEQTSDMMVDTVNENVNEDEEDETEDGRFEAMFDSNRRTENPSLTSECQYNRDGSYNGAKHGDGDEDDADAEEEGGARRGRRESSGSGSSQGSSIADDAAFAQKVHRLQTAKQKLQQLRDLVAMVQVRQGFWAREKLYEEKLRQQQQELKQLHEERQRLMEIQGKIQDLQWACPDLQSSMSSAASGVAATMMKKLPAAASTPAVAPSTSAKSNTAVLKHTTEPAPVTITDNELWSEMRRHQVLREELRQRRKHLESLMAASREEGGP
ncbi:hypothetical protein AMELA_G00276240 [Ameiurus melas]|uniref:Pericentriolar material 1 protein n=1 Tax=Ameiurus melas TaxID=219545 RepID=A0A7J5ZMM0_AMEME|nr:hypothetical protein AMELA_G00276240 [Ameiurus melas]